MNSASSSVPTFFSSPLSSLFLVMLATWKQRPLLQLPNYAQTMLELPDPKIEQLALTEAEDTAGPLRSTGITPLRRYCWPLRHPLAFPPTSWFCQLYGFLASVDFSTGTSRVPPVAQRILVIVSLQPRQSLPPCPPVCDVPCCLAS